ncbi:MAG TPA: AfsR/SARP family transcriptional regulator [Actinospica sp.]|nr:AfsR/SARP family transcriptional regulator [Actinospica sp.]
MEFGLLGPLFVSDGSAVHAVSSGKQRALLAALLLRAGWVVRAEQLIETLWDSRPPRSAEVTLRNYVVRLRKSIGAAGARIRTSSGGYVFEAADEEIDLRIFDGLRVRAESALRAGDVESAGGMLDRALALWRGPALADVVSLTLHRDLGPALEEQRLHAVELKLRAECASGRSTAAIPELLRLTAAHPWRESLWGHLMVAYAQSGRQAEALAVFRRVQRMLADELAIRPGAELAALHARILAGDAVLPTSSPVLVGAPGRAG